MSGGSDPAACTTEQCRLGEGVRWDARRQELLRVDIVAGRVFRDVIGDDGALVSIHAYQLDSTVGAIAPVEGDDGWIVAAGRGLLHLTPDGRVHDVVGEVAAPGTRMNDAACDPQGRFWAGTMAEDQRRGAGALFRLDRGGRVDQMLGGLTIANGLGWSPDGTTMYVTDSGDCAVYAYRFDADRGTISDGRVLISVPDEIGAPDGMTVDAAGNLWVAVYGGGQVRCYSPNGALYQMHPLPTPQTTCCAFGGPGLRRLYVTTATEGWTDAERLADPRAGVVYRIDTEASGNPAAPFRPHPAWWGTVVP